MAKACRKCGANFPTWAWLNGRKCNLKNRRYCLTCSPFGSHNTRDPLAPRRSGAAVICPSCKRRQPSKQRKGRLCWTCAFGRRSEQRLDRAYAIVGETCWRCGYGRGRTGRRILDFHHVDRNEKLFGLDCRHIVNLSWARVLSEMRKCVLLCANCHREVESGLINVSEVRELHAARWASIGAAS